MKKTKKKSQRKPKPQPDPSRALGIKAIIGLQAMAGHPVSETYASIGWDRMSESQRKYTLRTYDRLRGSERIHVGRLPIRRGLA